MTIKCPRGCGRSFLRLHSKKHDKACSWWRPGCPTRSLKANLAEHEADCKKRLEKDQQTVRERDEYKKKYEELQNTRKLQQPSIAAAADSNSPAPLAEEAAGSAPPEAAAGAAGVKAECEASSQDKGEDASRAATDERGSANAAPLFRRTTSASPAVLVKAEASRRRSSLSQAVAAEDEEDELAEEPERKKRRVEAGEGSEE
ncbi:hypothetical protein JCM10450v2_001017 [Rhodotorula kratochvilovae]